MIEQDPVTDRHIVGFAVIDAVTMRRDLADAVGLRGWNGVRSVLRRGAAEPNISDEPAW